MGLLRADLSTCVSRWDPKTEKKAKKLRISDELERLADFLEGDALVIEPAAVFDPHDGEYGSPSIYGVLALTERQLLFHSAHRGQARMPLAEIDHLHLGPPQAGFFMSMSLGGLLEIRVGSAESLFEIETQGSAQRLWPALQAQVAAAKRDAAEGAAAGATSPAPPSVADELEKLVSLRDSGVLTGDEFDEQKRRLLAG